VCVIIVSLSPFRKIDIFLQRPNLLTTDLRAIHHILNRTDIYHKPPTAQRGLAQVLGWGVIVAEGEKHRLQRKALNPAFGLGQLRDLTNVFLDKANEVSHTFSPSFLLSMLNITLAQRRSSITVLWFPFGKRGC
jgi:cytochrome P450